MAHLIHVDGAHAEPCTHSSMIGQGLTEPRHLEAWIVDHPEVLDDTLKVIGSQFNRWASSEEVAKERLDVLALATSGELVVIELKRDGDRRIHLQALTYGALVAGFTRDDLAAVHADWMTRHGKTMSQVEALAQLTDHVDGEWSDDLLRLPRLMLVAESFPAQVLTTVQWLQDVAPDLTIECHEYQLFTSQDDVFVSFRRLFPVENIVDRLLRPSVHSDAQQVRDKLATNQRRAKSVTVIEEYGSIPEGAPITLELDTLVKPESAQAVNAWLDATPGARDITWTRSPNKPLRWALEPGRTWTPSALRNEIFNRAGLPAPSFSAADAWCHQGTCLYWIANNALAQAQETVDDELTGDPNSAD